MLVDLPAAPAAPAAGPQRIELQRTRRKVRIAAPTGRVRHRLARSLLACDVATLGAAVLIGSRIDAATLVTCAEAMPPVIVTAYVLGAYRLDALLRALSIKTLILAVAVAFALVCVVRVSIPLLPDPAAADRLLLLARLVAVAVGVGASRVVARSILSRREADAALLYVGPLAGARALARALRDRGVHSPVFAFPSGSSAAPADGEDAVAGLEIASLGEFDGCLEGPIRAIVLADAPQNLAPRLLEDLVHARLLNIPIQPLSQFYEELWERTPVALGDPSWFLSDDLVRPSRSAAYLATKRAVDVVAAMVGLIAAAPVMLIVAIMVRLTSPGPALYSQCRVGLWKRPFTIHKFRTMRIDAEAHGARWAAERDPRITRLGGFLRRTRLDELPQLWNVLVGDMTLVGPRPERPEFTGQLEQVIPYYDFRHLVKPGVTGWAQVRYPYGASVEDAVAKLEYEIFYIKRASLGFDLRILLRTIGIVLGYGGR